MADMKVKYDAILDAIREDDSGQDVSATVTVQGGTSHREGVFVEFTWGLGRAVYPVFSRAPESDTGGFYAWKGKRSKLVNGVFNQVDYLVFSTSQTPAKEDRLFNDDMFAVAHVEDSWIPSGSITAWIPSIPVEDTDFQGGEHVMARYSEGDIRSKFCWLGTDGLKAYTDAETPAMDDRVYIYSSSTFTDVGYIMGAAPGTGARKISVHPNVVQVNPYYRDEASDKTGAIYPYAWTGGRGKWNGSGTSAADYTIYTQTVQWGGGESSGFVDADDFHDGYITGTLPAGGGPEEFSLTATTTLGAESVTTGKLADGAVTTPKIADGAVTREKLSYNTADDAIYGAIYDPSDPSPAVQQVRLVGGELVEVSGFDWLPAHEWRRCVMDDLRTRHVAYYLDRNDSTKKEDGTPACLTGEDGDVMVEIPVVHWRVDTRSDGTILYLVSLQPFAGSSPHPFFYVSPDGATLRTQYIGAYIAGASEADGTMLNTNEEATDSAAYGSTRKLRSAAGIKPFSATTLANARIMAQNNGGYTDDQGNRIPGGQVANSLFYQFLGLMMMIETGSFNSQAAVSEGFTNAKSGATYTMLRHAGRSNFGNGTGQTLYDPERDASIVWTDGLANTRKIISFQYRGIENPYGCVWQFEEGIQKYEYLECNCVVADGDIYDRDETQDSGNNRAWTNGSTTYWTKTLLPVSATVLYSDAAATVDSGLKTSGLVGFESTGGCYWHTAKTADYTSDEQQGAASPVYHKTPHAWPGECYPKTWDPKTFFPLSSGGSTATYLCDYFYNDYGNNASRSVLRGGNLNNGSYAGSWYVNVHYGLGSSTWPFAFRLSA